MIIDFLMINTINIFSAFVLLAIFYLNDKMLYYILFIDLILNDFPLTTIIIIILFKFNKFIFKYLNENIYTQIVMMMLYYLIFGIISYGFYNELNISIINFLIKNLSINLLFYYLGIKFLNEKYS